jgi:hypothetical protein
MIGAEPDLPELTFEGEQPEAWTISDVCKRSSEYCEYLASDLRRPIIAGKEPPQSLPDEAEPPLRRQAEWAKHALGRVGRPAMTKLPKGPDYKTAQRIVNGLPVSESSLEKFADSLTFLGFKASVDDIPRD